MSSKQEKLTVIDKANSDASGKIAEAWLSPSEALTQFVPGAAVQPGAVRSVAAIRFGARVGDIGLMIPLGMLSEMVEEAEIYPLPTSPLWFQGLMNLRGSLVPVFDLKTLFGMEDHKVETPNLLVLDSREEAVGILIDGFPMTLDNTRILEQQPMLPPVLRDYSQAVYLRGEEVWVEFDFDGFFRAAGSQSVA